MLEHKPMKAFLPRIEIALSKIRHNAQVLTQLYGEKNISLMGVSKAFLGEPQIAQAMIEGGIKFIADSRLQNIQKMQNAGLSAQFVLLRTALSQAEAVVMNTDISLNTEIETITALSHYAGIHHKMHGVILMVELGDLREGILPCDLSAFIQKILLLPHIKIIGLGSNLACYGGIKPNHTKMYELSKLTNAIEAELQINFKLISGGNSANYKWYKSAKSVGRINNLRLGESILLGLETTNREAIPGLYTNAFRLIAEVIESKDKPSLPSGEACQDSFGNIPTFKDRGIHRRIILALGKQDTLVSGLTSLQDLEILGSSSDHIILESKNYDIKIGTKVVFTLDYGALLCTMTSPFIKKYFIKE
jgi:ornithine racemase